MARTILLVRHGATEWTMAGRIQGHADPDLSGHGRRQVGNLRRIVETHPVDHVVSSTLSRCRSTAELLGKDTDALFDEWREIDAGEWTGRLVEAVQLETPEAFPAWEAGLLQPPGGESRQGFSDRIRGAYETTAARYDGNILLVTHAQVIREVISLLLAVPVGSLALPDLASLTIVDETKHRILRSFNVTAGGVG